MKQCHTWIEQLLWIFHKYSLELKVVMIVVPICKLSTPITYEAWMFVPDSSKIMYRCE